MQQGAPGAYAGMVDCWVQTVRGEGVAGLFKGLPPPLISVAAYQAVCFASFSAALPRITDDPEELASVPALFLAGSLSGAATVFVTTPTDLIKIRLQLDKGGGGGMRDMARCARRIFAAEGLRGFCRGMEATAWRDTWSTGLYFVAYHVTKRWLAGLGRHPDAAGPAPPAGAAAELAAGGVAGVVAWGAVVPFDVVKTRLQGQVGTEAGGKLVETRFWPTFMQILRQEGWARLYTGVTPLLCRAFFVNAVTFWAYEECWRWIKKCRGTVPCPPA
jgi:solute carrier family 25 carnitine/acylcarnitine transporter 20/29